MDSFMKKVRVLAPECTLSPHLSRRMYLYFVFQLPGQTVGLHLKIIMGLKVHPELRLDSKIASEPQGRIEWGTFS